MMMNYQNNESIWINATKGGDQAAFTYLVEQYQRSIFNLCYRMLNDRLEAEDAVQETFLRAFQKLDSYDEARKFSSWLFSIASHYCLDQLKRKRLSVVSWDDVDVWQHPRANKSDQPENTFVAQEQANDVQHLLKILPPDYRASVILKYWHHYSCQEIADVLDLTVSAVKSKLFRARKMMANAVSTAGTANPEAKQTNTKPTLKKQLPRKSAPSMPVPARIML
ncbi:MAG: sigma-70 family RNA polymerase sigma factor [Chloroflexota bacterium]